MRTAPQPVTEARRSTRDAGHACADVLHAGGTGDQTCWPAAITKQHFKTASWTAIGKQKLASITSWHWSRPADARIAGPSAGQWIKLTSFAPKATRNHVHLHTRLPAATESRYRAMRPEPVETADCRTSLPAQDCINHAGPVAILMQCNTSNKGTIAQRGLN